MADRMTAEILTGAAVLAFAGLFCVKALTGGFARVGGEEGYAVSAAFGNVGTLATGADVRLGGVKVGKVSDVRLDPVSYRAVVTLHVRDDVALPDDTAAAVVSDGLLGGKFVSLSPGGGEAKIADGGTLRYTQDAVSLEGLIGKFAFGSSDKKEEEGGKSDGAF